MYQENINVYQFNLYQVATFISVLFLKLKNPFLIGFRFYGPTFVDLAFLGSWFYIFPILKDAQFSG